MYEYFLGISFVQTVIIMWYVIQAMVDWKLLDKAGEKRYFSLIPFINTIFEYEICWNPIAGAAAIVSFLIPFAYPDVRPDNTSWVILASVSWGVFLLLHIIQSLKLATVFGKGHGFGIFLILFGPLARIYLGFDDLKYSRKQKSLNSGLEENTDGSEIMEKKKIRIWQSIAIVELILLVLLFSRYSYVKQNQQLVGYDAAESIN